MSILASLRQLNYPKEFRIPPPAWPAEVLRVFEQLAQSAPEREQAPAATDNLASSKEWTRLAAELGTQLWRLRLKMLAPGATQPIEEMRRVYRHVEPAWDALHQFGVEVKDHTGDLYDTGMALDVLAFQPTPGTVREKILETVKPSVYYMGKCIQMGQVIVAAPPAPEAAEK
jgi:hypothetical protein